MPASSPWLGRAALGKPVWRLSWPGRWGRLGEARAVLTLALRHPAAECETNARAAQILLAHEAALMPGAAAGAASKPTPADVDTAVAQLLGALAAWERGWY